MKSKGPSRRPQRMGDLLREEIARYILNGLKNDDVGFVTITDVRMTPDLQIARVYFTALGSEAQRAKSEGALAESAPQIRRHLGKVLRLRYTPKLEFFVDEGLEHSYKIQSLLGQVASEHEESENSDD